MITVVIVVGLFAIGCIALMKREMFADPPATLGMPAEQLERRLELLWREGAICGAAELVSRQRCVRPGRHSGAHHGHYGLVWPNESPGRGFAPWPGQPRSGGPSA